MTMINRNRAFPKQSFTAFAFYFQYGKTNREIRLSITIINYRSLHDSKPKDG